MSKAKRVSHAGKSRSVGSKGKKSKPVKRTVAAEGKGDRQPKPWTVLVWIAGDNNLDSAGLSDIAEMKKVGSDENVDIVVQYDSRGTTATARYHLHKDKKLDDDLIAKLGETNTGDPEVAIEFFTWGMTEFPSERVLAVIWNHGSGIDETDVYAQARDHGMDVARRSKPNPGLKTKRKTVPQSRVRQILTSKLRRSLFSTTIDAALGSRAIAYDDTSRDFLDNAELKRVLQRVVKQVGRPIDVLGFDACLMNMVEVAYQLRGMVGHIVGSEEVEPGDGWPYDRVLGRLSARPKLAGSELASTIVKEYLSSYSPADGVTQSAVDMARVVAIKDAVDGLASACIAALETDADYAAFGKAMNAAQRFRMRDFVDLGNFCTLLAGRTSRPELKQAIKVVLEALGGESPFVLAEGHKGASVAGATGTAIYFPTAGDTQVVYEQLDFARDTRWHDLIKKYKAM